MHWNITRQALIDKTAIYMLQWIFPMEADDLIKITGVFPPSLYFSFQIYGSPAGEDAGSVILDKDITAKCGRNPFSDPTVCSEEEKGIYEVHITKDGKKTQQAFPYFEVYKDSIAACFEPISSLEGIAQGNLVNK